MLQHDVAYNTTQQECRQPFKGKDRIYPQKQGGCMTYKYECSKCGSAVYFGCKARHVMAFCVDCGNITDHVSQFHMQNVAECKNCHATFARYGIPVQLIQVDGLETGYCFRCISRTPCANDDCLETCSFSSDEVNGLWKNNGDGTCTWFCYDCCKKIGENKTTTTTTIIKTEAEIKARVKNGA